MVSIIFVVVIISVSITWSVLVSVSASVTVLASVDSLTSSYWGFASGLLFKGWDVSVSSYNVIYLKVSIYSLILLTSVQRVFAWRVSSLAYSIICL